MHFWSILGPRFHGIVNLLIHNIEFSIGIGRYPDNGKDLDLIKKKIQKAINMARSKGGNRYIIYKEFLHGEIEDYNK